MPTKTTSAPSAQLQRYHINVLGQLLKYISRGIVDAAAREFGVDVKARAYSVWSHLAAMVFVQLAHAFSQNDVCDWLRLMRRAVASFGVTPPARNTLSVIAPDDDVIQFIESLDGPRRKFHQSLPMVHF